MTETQAIAARAESAGARFFVERGRAWYGGIENLETYTLTLLLAEWPRIEVLLLAERGGDRGVLAALWADDAILRERFATFDLLESYVDEMSLRLLKSGAN